MQNTDIDNARALVEQAEKQLAEARAMLAKATETPKEWEPTRGPWTAFHAGVDEADSDKEWARLGMEFATEAAAQSAFDYIAWYRLLCNLAAQLNPGGKVGGAYNVFLDGSLWTAGGDKDARAVGFLFETYDAAERAAEILNRQKGTLAGRKCPFLQ